ncbi:MAG: hypothetical protein ACWGQW_00045 [bacterium]
MVKRFPSNFPHREVYPEQWPNLGTGELAIPGMKPVQTATQALVANTAMVWPWFNPIGIGIASANIMLSTGVAATTAKIALFEWDHINRTCLDVIAQSAAAFNTTTAEQGKITDAAFLGGYEPGWYAWAVVSDGAITLRLVEGVDEMAQGLLTPNTTNLESDLHYTFDGTGIIAGSFADDPTVTPVVSTSNFLAQQAVLLDFALNPAFN